MFLWQQWLQHPERSSLRNAVFQTHLWTGALASMYVLLISISGSIIVFRNDLPTTFSIEWLVKLHTNLLSGPTGRITNGVGAVVVTLLCITGAVIWWPGITHLRRSVTVNFRAHFARISWDLHSALGFWCFLFVVLWGLSGIYFSFPQIANALFVIDPKDHFADQGLFVMSELHFGRFSWFTKIVWGVVGMVPATLAFTGVFICCRRVMYKKPAHPDRFVA